MKSAGSPTPGAKSSTTSSGTCSPAWTGSIGSPRNSSSPLSAKAKSIEWTDPWLQSIDLEYHNIALDHGLYYELIRTGQMRRFISEQDIKNAIFQPPETTRAFFRGR